MTAKDKADKVKDVPVETPVSYAPVVEAPAVAPVQPVAEQAAKNDSSGKKVNIDSDFIEAIRASLRQRGVKVTHGDVVSALSVIDVDALYSTVDDVVTWELWDKESPINGADASYVKSRSDYTGGAVYLVKIDGRVVMLQPHSPGAEGFVAMSDVEASDFANKERQQVVDSEYLRTITDEVREKLR